MLFLLGTTMPRLAYASAGNLDLAFTENSGRRTAFDSDVRAIAVQSDGKIVVGGFFSNFNGVSANRIMRLNTDGTVDASFRTNIGTGFNNSVTSVALQSDGKILVGGAFTTFNGGTNNRIMRLNADGTADTTFRTNIGSGANGSSYSIVVQSDGKILMGGDFSTFNGVGASRIMRLNSDGTADTTFRTNIGSGFGADVWAIAVQSNGKIAVAGTFTTFNGTTNNRIMRLNSDGTADTTFRTNIGTGFDLTASSISLQSDGKIVVGGSFTTFNGGTNNRIMRLNTDGTADTTFRTNIGTGFGNQVLYATVQSDDKIVVGGRFTTFNGGTNNYIMRLNSDGTADTTFRTNIGTGFDNEIWTAFVQSDGKILAGGLFSSFAGATSNRIMRLNSGGTADSTFRNNISGGFDSSIRTVAIQSDGKILVGGDFTNFNGVASNYIMRLNSDGTADTTFQTNIGTGFDNIVYSIAVQSDGKIVVGGAFGTFDGVSSSFILRLNSNGTADSTFRTNSNSIIDSSVNAVAVQSDGKILVGGDFSEAGGAAARKIMRLNSNGTADTTFRTNVGTGFDAPVNAITVQSDGKIMIGGGFTEFDGTSSVRRIARLNTDGTLDTSFSSSAGGGFDSDVRTVAIQSDGKIVAGGDFTTFDAVNPNYIMRLNSDGTADTTFLTNIGTGLSTTVQSVAVQSDGKIVVAGGFDSFDGVAVGYITRLNSDGTADTVFRSNTDAGFDSTTYAVALQSDGKIVVGGGFTGFNNQVTSNGKRSSYLARLQASAATVSYSGSFTEAAANDGSVNGSIAATLTNDTFVNPITLTTHVTVANVPAGLTAVVTRDSSTQVTVTLTGTATAHANANDVSNLTITFLNGAFTDSIVASSVTGYQKSNGTIDFNNPTVSGSSSSSSDSSSAAIHTTSVGGCRGACRAPTALRPSQTVSSQPSTATPALPTNTVPTLTPVLSLGDTAYSGKCLDALGNAHVSDADKRSFMDVPKDTWFYDHVTEANQAGVVEGLKDLQGNLFHQFQPERTVTLAEAVKMLLSAASDGPDTHVLGEQWYKPFLDKAKENNLLSPLSSSVTASMPLTRADAVSLLLVATCLDGAKFKIPVPTTRFLDVTSQTRHAHAIWNGAALGVIQGYEDGTFKPEQNVNRAEMITMILRAMETKQKMLETLPPPAQLPVHTTTPQLPEPALHGAASSVSATTQDASMDVSLEHRYIVTSFALNLRLFPRMDAPRTTTLSEGQVVIVDEVIVDTWAKIHVPDIVDGVAGREGYVVLEKLRPMDEANNY